MAASLAPEGTALDPTPAVDPGATGGDDGASASESSQLEQELGALFDGPVAGALDFRTEAPAAPAPAGTEAPAATATALDPAAEALAGTEPYRHTVGTEARDIPGAYHAKGEGVFIPEDRLPEFARYLDGLAAHEARATQHQTTASELERATTFNVPAQGTEAARTLRGPDAIAHMRTELVRQQIALSTYEGILANPERYIALLAKDGEKTILNPEAVRSLLDGITQRQQIAAYQVRDAIGTLRTTPAPTGAPDYSRVAPQVVTATLTSLGDAAKVLTDVDRTYLNGMMPRFVRATTADDRRANPALTLGAPIIDAGFLEVVKDRIALRGESANMATSAQAAATENARRLAAAGVGGVPPKPATRERAPSAESQRVRDAEDAWDMRERMAAGRVRGG